MEPRIYTKLINLVDDQFTIKKVEGFCYKVWDVAQNKMLISETPQKGYGKRYQVITDKGKMDLSQSQLGNCLEGVVYDGKADINGKTFSVKSNGKTDMEIRYFINPVESSKTQVEPVEEDIEALNNLFND